MKTIREERPGDEAAIRALTAAAFEGMAFSAGTEPAIIDALRRDGDLTLSLVAEEGGIVGHVAFSGVAVGAETSGWFGLGPVSVRPARQRCGIGTALIERGLSDLRERGAKGCVLIGDPAYYGRFGFEGDISLRYADVPASHIQGLSFGSAPPSGEITYADGFSAR